MGKNLNYALEFHYVFLPLAGDNLAFRHTKRQIVGFCEYETYPVGKVGTERSLQRDTDIKVLHYYLWKAGSSPIGITDQ